MIDINPSKSILDQVDEYLHENHNFIDKSNNNHVVNNSNNNNINIPIHNDIHLLERELSKSHGNYPINNIGNNNNVTCNDKNDAWISHNIQLDLDKLNNSIFQESSFDNPNNIPNFSNISDGYHNPNHTLTNTNYPLSVHKEINSILTVPAAASFSPNASPLIAPNQASMSGVQVTPFMHPLTLKNDFDFDDKDTSAPNNDNGRSILGDSVSVLDPLSTLNSSVNDIPIIDDYGSKIVPLTRSVTNTSKNENSNTTTNIKNKISIPKKSHSISGQSTIPRSDQNAKVVKNSPYMKPNRSIRRFSKSKTSLENTPILPSTNITTITTPIPNSSSSNSSNNNVQINIPGNMDDTAFQLPESSVISDKPYISLNTGIDYNATLLYTNDINPSNTTITNSTGNKDSNKININTTDKSKIAIEDTKKENDNNTSERRPRSKSRAGRIKDESKREIHKMAEQERRNRLNNALSELASLIPEELKKTVTIPSKATTAELACVYIRQLEKELSKKDS